MRSCRDDKSTFHQKTADLTAECNSRASTSCSARREVNMARLRFALIMSFVFLLGLGVGIKIAWPMRKADPGANEESTLPRWTVVSQESLGHAERELRGRSCDLAMPRSGTARSCPAIAMRGDSPGGRGTSGVCFIRRARRVLWNCQKLSKVIAARRTKVAPAALVAQRSEVTRRSSQATGFPVDPNSQGTLIPRD